MTYYTFDIKEEEKTFLRNSYPELYNTCKHSYLQMHSNGRYNSENIQRISQSCNIIERFILDFPMSEQISKIYSNWCANYYDGMMILFAGTGVEAWHDWNGKPGTKIDDVEHITFSLDGSVFPHFYVTYDKRYRDRKFRKFPTEILERLKNETNVQ